MLGPFPLALGQLKYLIVAIDYFTKWIEVEPLYTITTAQCWKFIWQNIITRYSILRSVIINNGTQFIDIKFKYLLSELEVR